MAKKNNVHPDYYKTAGREPVGQNTVHEQHKRELTSATKAESSKEMRRGKSRKREVPPSLASHAKRKPNRPARGTGSQKMGGGHETQQPNESG
jgi:hypothetical protein